MDSKKLEILMTAVDLGSFSKASEVVGYTQSGLTHLVDSLEREIGLTLVRRDHSGIALTEEGEALMPAIREFLRANAKKMAEKMSSASHSLDGSSSMGATPVVKETVAHLGMANSGPMVRYRRQVKKMP